MTQFTVENDGRKQNRALCHRDKKKTKKNMRVIYGERLLLDPFLALLIFIQQLR